MVKTNLSSKGQVTIPLSFRKRMHLTPTQTVELDQLPDGAVILRPVRSILDLAGGLKPVAATLSHTEERKRARELMANRSRSK
jgi:AbrB family looped-hinge helix DNA binding protein